MIRNFYLAVIVVALMTIVETGCGTPKSTTSVIAPAQAVSVAGTWTIDATALAGGNTESSFTVTLAPEGTTLQGPSFCSTTIPGAVSNSPWGIQNSGFCFQGLAGNPTGTSRPGTFFYPPSSVVLTAAYATAPFVGGCSGVLEYGDCLAGPVSLAFVESDGAGNYAIFVSSDSTLQLTNNGYAVPGVGKGTITGMWNCESDVTPVCSGVSGTFIATEAATQ